MRNRVVVGLLAVLAGTACATPRDVPTLAGAYAANMNGASDTLWLRADGRWTRRFKPANGLAASDSGAWVVSQSGRTVGITGFPRRWIFIHEYASDTTPAAITLTISRARMGTGRLRLGWHPEWNWYFERVGD